MTVRREALIIVAALATAVTVYGGVTWPLVFFQFSNQQADFKDLLIELAPFVVPLPCAMLAAVLVAKALHGKRENDRGFQVLPNDRDGRGAA